MAAADGTQGQAISSPVVIVVCIAGAVVAVIIVAALYRLCRRLNAEADRDVDDRTWNPNQRNRAQDKYMEEVRWRNNAVAWADARADDDRGYRRGWFREHLEERRLQEDAGWAPVSVHRTDENDVVYPYHGQEVTAEEFLSHIAENPYQDLLDQRLRSQAHPAMRCSPEKDRQRIQLDNDIPQMPPVALLSQEARQVKIEDSPVNGTGVRITINDEAEDIVDAELPGSNRFPPRQSQKANLHEFDKVSTTGNKEVT